MTTLIKNGTIITATDMYKADLLVKNGVISEIGREISKIASEIIDAADKWVLPFEGSDSASGFVHRDVSAVTIHGKIHTDLSDKPQHLITEFDPMQELGRFYNL